MKDQSKLSRPPVTVIGGGHPQLCLIEAFKQLDCHITVIDNRNQVPGRRLADNIVEIDRYDLQTILDHTRANPPDYVASGGSDKAVYVAARIAEAFGLPTYVSSDVATLPMQKADCQKLLTAAGVPCPFTVYGTSIHTFEQLDWSGIRFPVVVKPDRGIGQTGVDRAEDPDQALTSIASAFAVTENGTVIVQELVEGNEIGINGIVLDGTFYLLTTSYRRSSRRRGGAFGVAMEKVFPAITTPIQLRHLTKIVQQACTALNIINGPIYAQAIVTTDHISKPFSIIEIMPRLGGGEDPRLVAAATGFDLAKATALLCLGRPVAPPTLNKTATDRAAVLRFIAADPGYVTTIHGLEAVRSADGVVGAEVFVYPGQLLKPLASSRERAGYVLTVGPDATTAANAAHAAADSITITTVNDG